MLYDSMFGDRLLEYTFEPKTMRSVTDGFVACAFKVAFCYLAEGDEVQALVELGKEDVPVVAQETGAEAQFTRFLGGGLGRAPT